MLISMNKTDIDEIIGDSLTDSINEHEKEILDTWLSESEDNRKSYFLIKEMWDNNTIEQKHSNADELYMKVENKIDQQSSKGSVNYRQFFKYAAAAALLIVSTYFVVTSEIFRVNQGENEISFVEKKNEAGKKSRILLSDGSVVILSTESSIKYSSNFGQNPREISLTGEAHFEVAHDPSNPFVVITDNVRTTALGTSFNIKSYPNEDKLKISLITGTVRVDKYSSQISLENPSETYLVAGEAVVYSREMDEIRKEIFNAESLLWKDGILYFNNTNLEDIMPSLERWYAVDIVVKGHQNIPQYFSGTFKNKSLESVLGAMSFSKKFDYSIDGKTVTIELNKNN